MTTALSALASRGVTSAEQACLTLPQAQCSVYHHFAPGLYIREVHMPKGTIAVGHEQRYPQWNIFLKGKVRMIRGDGTSEVLEAPIQFVGPAGRKMGEVLEDVVWQNVYATDETDVEKLEELFVIKSPEWKTQEAAVKAKAFAKHIEDRRDYRRVLREVGIKEEQARCESECTVDLIPFPHGSYGVKLGDSSIEGKGLFATRSYEAGETVAPARFCGMRTPAGRFVNHSATPNCLMQLCDNGDILLVTKQALTGCVGGFDGEELTIDYRNALALVGRGRYRSLT